MHGHGRGSFTHVRHELWPRVILGYRLMGISACMAREGSFTHVRRVLRPRVGISACMVTGGGVLLMLGASTGQGLFWGRVYLGYLHAWPRKGVLLMLGAQTKGGNICMHGHGRGSFTHVRHELWPSCMHGQGREFYSC